MFTTVGLLIGLATKDTRTFRARVQSAGLDMNTITLGGGGCLKGEVARGGGGQEMQGKQHPRSGEHDNTAAAFFSQKPAVRDNVTQVY